MLDRASTFSDPEVVKLLKTKFVPVAIDQAYQRRQKDTEGRFYQKIANQGPRKVGDGGPTTQGLYTAAADGSFLGYNNNRGPGRVLKMMREALAKFESPAVDAIDPGKPDRRFNYGPPEGGLVVRVNSKVLGGYEETDDPWRLMFQQGIGRDNFWVRKDEHDALVRGELPASFVTRMARFHLVDNTRGEPPMWKPEEIIKSEVVIEDGKLRGKVHLRNGANDREFKADLFGFVTVKNGKVTRFDVLAKGLYRGEGRFTKRAPEGEFPFAVAFRLADGSDIADEIPPQGSRGWLDGYIR